MEVRNDVFLDELEDLRREISDSVFISIDTELGGLHTEDDFGNLLHTVKERYRRTHLSAMNFPILQYGVCTWRWDKANSRYNCYPRQFYIYPRTSEKTKANPKQLPNRHFKMESVCLEYIRRHGFDMNEWIDHGVPYISESEQRELCHTFEKSFEKYELDDSDTIIMDEKNTAYLNRFTRQVQEKWPEEQPKSQNSAQRAIVESVVETVLADEEDEWTEIELQELFLSPCKGQFCKGKRKAIDQFTTEKQGRYRRAIIKDYVKQNRTDILVLDCEVDNPKKSDSKPWFRSLRVIKVPDRSASLRARMIGAYNLAEQSEIKRRNEARIGFTLVMEAIRASRKPVVGHNLLLDLAQSYQKFCNSDLPTDVNDFAKACHEWLPCIFDTKHLLTIAKETVDSVKNYLKEGTKLDDVYDKLRTNVVFSGSGDAICLPQPIQKLVNDNRSPTHQAGFDAYMTGFVFIRICEAMEIRHSHIQTISDGDLNHHTCSKVHKLKDLSNHLSLGKFIPYHTIPLPGPVHEPKRDCYLFLEQDKTRSSNFSIKFEISSQLRISIDLIRVYWIGKGRAAIQVPSADHVQRICDIIQKDDTVFRDFGRLSALTKHHSTAVLMDFDTTTNNVQGETAKVDSKKRKLQAVMEKKSCAEG